MWAEEARDQRCRDYIEPVTQNDVRNQFECQLNCTARVDCVGILYSYKEAISGWCYMCLDDNLSSAGNNFGFYRKPDGISTKEELKLLSL